MADVTLPSLVTAGDGDGNRGQLFIVTALLLAVLFVVLALLLNTAIFTENLATRSADPGAGEAVQFRNAADAGVGELIEYVNRHDRTAPDSLKNRLETAIAEWSAGAGRHAVARTHSATVSYPDDGANIHYGAQIVQTDPGRSFEDAQSRETWDVVDDADNLRSFNVTLSREVLHDRTDTQPDPTPSDEFYVRVDGDGGDWYLTAYRYDDEGDGIDDGDPIVVDVRAPADSSFGGEHTCEVAGPRAVVDLVAGTVNGSLCSFPSVTDEIGPDYDVTYVNAGNAVGAYHLVVDETVSDIEGDVDIFDDSYSGTVGESPFLADAVWDVDVDVTFTTPDAYYETEIDVEPGEDDE